VGRFRSDARAVRGVRQEITKWIPSTENYPANGVTFEQAKAYTEWLSKLTGQTWRLPHGKKESAGWYEKKDGEKHSRLLGRLRAKSR